MEIAQGDCPPGGASRTPGELNKRREEPTSLPGSELEQKVIFVVGNPRSGTTMMGRILGNNSLVYWFPREIHFFENLWSPPDKRRTLDFEQSVDLAARLICISNDRFFTQGNHRRFETKARRIVESMAEGPLRATSVYEAFLRHMAGESGKSIPCEHTPGYVYYIPEILELFPEARIIVMTRDPRDVLLSQKNRWKRRFLGKDKIPLRMTIRTFMNYHPISTSRLWDAAAKRAHAFAGDERVHIVRFEDVLQDPEKEVQAVCGFIGIPFHKSMLDIPLLGSSLVSDRLCVQGIDARRMSNWQKKEGLDSAEKFLAQTIAADGMRTNRYRPVKVFPNPALLAFYLLTWPPKLVIALLFHMKYIRSIRDAVSRRFV